jgi:L-ascorbate metabolism protein UlaG (beta-lactamase superfamily)
MSEITVTYAGHSAVLLEVMGRHVAIDPWLKGNPLCPASLQNPSTLDLIAVTHGHSDHASDVVRLQKHTGATVAATYELAMIFVAEGVPADKVIPMNKGGTAVHAGVSITLTDAFHSSSYDGKHGPVYAGEACGVVIAAGGSAVYHAGDTSLFSDMRLIGERYTPAIALLPIGDRFTMGPTDAAKAAALIKAKVTIPIHYKTFDLLTGTYEEFARECKALHVATAELEPGQSRKC